MLKKPYTEISEEEGRSDELVAAEYWQNHLARNRSIFVDLMTGLLKSTITCVECGWISIKFDPMTSI